MKRFGACIAFLLLAGGCTQPAPHASRAALADCAPAPSDPQLALRVAGADMIVSAIARKPSAKALTAENAQGYETVAVSDVRWIKGSATTEPLVIGNFGGSRFALTQQIRSDLQKSPRLFFISWSAGSPYFAGPAGPVSDDEAIEHELARQAQVMARWKGDKTWPHYAAVKAIVDKMAALKRPRKHDSNADFLQFQALYEQLERLPVDAVPALVAQIDDNRPLDIDDIMVEPFDPNWFEKPHVEVKQVSDVLRHALIRITRPGVDIVYADDDAHRATLAAAWKVYASGQMCGVTWPRLPTPAKMH